MIVSLSVPQRTTYQVHHEEELRYLWLLYHSSAYKKLYKSCKTRNSEKIVGVDESVVDGIDEGVDEGSDELVGTEDELSSISNPTITNAV